MGKYVNEEEKARRTEAIKMSLARNPSLTRNHFHRNWGLDYPFLDGLAAAGVVKFGKPKKSYSGWMIRRK